MPPKPRWYADLPRIRREIESLSVIDHPTIDRRTIQDLFGLKARQANTLMLKLKGRKRGSNSEIFRADLLERIEEMAGPGGVAAAEIQQKVSAASVINTLQRQARPKKIPLPPPKPAGALLPFGVSQFAPGKVLIDYTTSEELLSRVVAIAKSAKDDFASFDAGLEYPPTRNGDCTVYGDTPAADSYTLQKNAIKTTP